MTAIICSRLLACACSRMLLDRCEASRLNYSASASFQMNGMLKSGGPRPDANAAAKICLRASLRPATQPPIRVLTIDGSPVGIEGAQ
jgi:hypothetical protein